MRSASHSFCILMLVTIGTFILFNSELNGATWDLRGDTGTSSTGTEFLDDRRELVEKVSGEDNADVGLLTRIRVLMGLKSSRTGRPTNYIKVHPFSPAPAPAPAPVESALVQAPIAPFHTHVYYRAPLPHKSHIPSVHGLETGRGHEAKVMRARRVIIAVAVSVGATIIIFGIIIVVCKRSQGRRRCQRTRSVSSTSKIQIPSSASNKVNSDPGPDLFYLNSLAPFLETDSTHKLSSESKNAILNNSTLSSPSKGGETIKCETDNVSYLDEEIDPADFSSSDNESFHSLCNSHSSGQSFVMDEPLSLQSANCSPFNSSYKSSPSCRVTQHISARSPMPSASPDSTHSIPLKLKPYCSDSESKTTASPNRLIIWDGRSVHSTHPLMPPSTHKKIEGNLTRITSIGHTFGSKKSSSEDSEPHSPPKDSKYSPPAAEAPFISLSLELSSLPVETTQASMASPSPSNSVLPNKQTEFPTKLVHMPKPPTSSQPPLIHGNANARKPPPHPSQSLPILPNGSIPKPPPPPPLPPLKPPLFQKGCISSRLPPPPPPLPPLKPPLLQRGCISSQLPPPLPRPLEQCTPVGKDGAPLPKLKPLHWDKVRAASDRSMVWDKIRSSSFELDEEMMESLFGYNKQCSVKNEEAKSKSSSPGKQVLDNKRLQNITILLKALNATAEQICDALVQGKGLTAQQLEALVKMVPMKEEEEKLSKYEGDISELGPAEQFIKAILHIPFAFSRIEVMLYKETFEDEVVHLRKSFAMIDEACKELRSSRFFLRLLEAVLKTGNRMNVGTIRGGARAFKLDALLKLADVKGTDGKTTLLHFVVQEMIRSEGVSAMEKAIQQTSTQKNKQNSAEEKEEDIRLIGLHIVSELNTELSNAKKTASVDLDVLVTSVSNLSNGLGQLKHLIQVDLYSEKSGSFVLSIKSFMNHAQRIIKELKDDKDKVLLHVREITEYYHGDVSKDEANPLRIFVIVRDFLSMLDRVCKDVRSLKSHLGANPVIPFR